MLVELYGVLHDDRYLEIVETVGHLLALIEVLAALLYIHQSALDEHRSLRRELHSAEHAEVETGLRIAAVERLVVGVDGGERRTDAYAHIHAVDAEAIVAVGIHGVVAAAAVVMVSIVLIALRLYAEHRCKQRQGCH